VEPCTHREGAPEIRRRRPSAAHAPRACGNTPRPDLQPDKALMLEGNQDPDASSSFGQSHHSLEKNQRHGLHQLQADMNPPRASR